MQLIVVSVKALLVWDLNVWYSLQVRALIDGSCNLVTRLFTVPGITYQYPTNIVASSVTKFQALLHFIYRDFYKVSWAFLAFSLSSKTALQLDSTMIKAC